MTSEDLQEGKELLFAFENKHKDINLKLDSPLKNLDEEYEGPSFMGLMHYAINYFDETSTIYSQ